MTIATDVTLEPGMFRISPAVDRESLASEFREAPRVRTDVFLDAGTADALFAHLSAHTAWNAYLTDDGRHRKLPANESGGWTGEQEAELLRRAHRSARMGEAAYVHEAFEEAPRGSGDRVGAPLSARFATFVNSAPFLEFASSVCGDLQFRRADAWAVRRRSGHFASYRSARPAVGGQGSAFYVYHLTPEWRPEWGGSLGFRNTRGAPVAGYPPVFNRLDVFGLPQGHWIDPIASFAGGPSYCFTGGLHTDEP